MKLIKPVLAALAVLAVMSVISCKHPAADSVEDPEPAKPVYTDYTTEVGEGTAIFKTVYWEIPEGVTIQKATLKSEKYSLPADEPTEILERENCSTYDAFFKKIIDVLTDEAAEFLGKAAASVTEEELEAYVLENSDINVENVPYLFQIALFGGYMSYVKENVFYGVVDYGVDFTDPDRNDMFYLDMFGFTTDWEFSDGTIITTLTIPDIR